MRRGAVSPFELPLALLRQTVAQSDLLPGHYARYRPLLADGLHFFLQRLSPARLRTLLTEQAQLPQATHTAERVVRLLRHSPALHKLGQIVARDHRLQPTFRQRLQRLESMAPTLSAPEVRRLLDRAFPAWRRTGVRLGPAPLAEGSVAVVMPFALPARRSPKPKSGSTRTRGADARPNPAPAPASEPGVFKLLKPGIRALLHEDLQILGALGAFLDEDCARYHLPPLDYRETFGTIRRLLLHEVRLDEEQRHLAEAARLYRAVDCVRIPALFPFCSSRVTAMQRLSGAKLAETTPSPRRSARAIARIAAEALVAAPLFSNRAAALFHADPHAGNLLLTPEGRVGILDWSLVGRLHKSERVAFVQLLLGGLEMNLARMAKAIQTLARKPAEPAALQDILRESLRELRWGSAPGLAWLARLLDQLVLRAGLRLPGHLLLFRKALLTLEGVLAGFTRTDPQTAWALLDQAVVGAFLQQCNREWPKRASAALDTRSFASNLSTADLLGLLSASPGALARWWTETGLDVAQAVSKVIISTTGSTFLGGAAEKPK